MLDYGFIWFVFERLSLDIEEIKWDFVFCFIDIRIFFSCKGIDIFGIVEGIDKYFLRFVDLIINIEKVFVLIDRLGMIKFFFEGKGFKLLKVIEDSNNCIIIISERNGNIVFLIYEVGGRKL